MKKSRFIPILSILLLCLAVAVPLFMTGTAESFDLDVYLSASGSGTADGLTESTPVSTFAEALAVAKAEVGEITEARVRFILLSDLTVYKDPYGTEPVSIRLTVTGKTGAEAVTVADSYVHHVCDTRYENMGFKQGATTNYAFLCANGYDLVMGKDLTCTPKSNGFYLNLTGGNYGSRNTTLVSDSSLTVLSGDWETLYAGSYKGNQTGNANLYAENCKIHTNVGTCYTEDHKGQSTITLKNCQVAIKSDGMLQGGPTNAAGSLTGKLTLTVENCKVRDFGVGFKRAITSPLELTVKDTAVKDAFSVTATGDKSITLVASAENTLDLTPATDFEASVFLGGGTLILGSESTLTLGEVSGSTALAFGGTPASRTYVHAPKETPDSAFTYSGVPAVKTATDGDVKFWFFSTAVTLKAPEDVTLTLYPGFDGGTALTPTRTKTENGVTFYTFADLTAGNYRYNVKGTDYYQITKNLLLTGEKLAAEITVDCTPPLRAKTGFEPSPSANANVKDYTDEMHENFLKSEAAQWPQYGFIFQSPYFTRASYETGLHQATTQDEMLAFLKKCADENPNLYLYSLGQSPHYGFEVPVLVFTASDLSDAETLEEAAAICKANGKLNFQYQAQVHGNEPGAGEGALALIGALSTAWGDQYLNAMNLCIIPRINTDGARNYTRNQVANNRNLNRDYLLLEAAEIPLILKAYNLFSPEVVVDGHEFTVSTSSTSGAYNDVALATGGNESANPAFEENGVNMILAAFDRLKAQGLTSNFYTGIDDSTDPCTARAYYQMRGSVSLLLETNGIHTGQNALHRRVVSQFISMETYLNYAVENASALQSLSKSAKEKLVQDGGAYSADRIFPLKTATVSYSDSFTKTVYSFATGLATGTKKSTPKSCDDVQRSRPLPTAYVIPKNAAGADVLRIARNHKISFYELEADTAAYLYGYSGSYDASTHAVTGVSLTEESLVSFPDGAYVFPMNQESALILAAMFEPDNEDIYNASDRTFTLAQKGTVSFENGSFAMYRSQRTLTDGKIEAIYAAEAPAGLSVSQPAGGSYTGTILGLDPADSYEIRHESESIFTPVPAGSTSVEGVLFGFVEVRVAGTASVPASKSVTLEIIPPVDALCTVYLAPASGSDSAYGRESDPVKSLDKAVALLSVLQRYGDSRATLVFTETLNTTAALQFPAHGFPLYVISKTGEEGIRSSTHVTFGGETYVDNFTFTYTGTGYVYIIANGHKLTLGEKVRSVGEKDVYYMPTGGGHEQTVESTDLTVLAGTWRNIYAGGYRGGVTGDVKLTLKNCTVVSHVQNSYRGKTSGNVTYDLENVTVQTSILCGNAALDDVAGNVTVTAKNCTVPLLYAGSRDAGNVLGKVNVTLTNCTATDLYGTAMNAEGTVFESHLTLIGTTPTGTVEGWTSVNTGTPTVKGDVDGSGEVTMDDAIYLLFHYSFSEGYPVSQPVDFDGSGAFDMDDAIYLLFHYSFPDGYPLH